MENKKTYKVQVLKDATGSFIPIKQGKRYIGQRKVSLRQEIKATYERLGIIRKRYQALAKIERRKLKVKEELIAEAEARNGVVK
jgi:hypothetical protein